ncbi:NlpC/P60 family protein [Streptomyces sp. NPDC005774]|uniref:NlpC/P60 family protein n=1 Tax=Streptomyces sp. NPDC005774 TaxID=3364728 RepID=UPI0036AB0D63
MFEEFDPVSDCDCPGCVHGRRALVPPRSPVVRTAGRRAVFRLFVLAAAAVSAVIGAYAAPALAAPHTTGRPGLPGVRGAPDDEGPATPQGPRGPLYGPDGRTTDPADPAYPADPSPPSSVRVITRADIIERAEKWVAAKVPYSVSAYWSDGYRQDCSGFVSMVWDLPANEWTGSLGQYAQKITKAELQPGDMLLFHNAADPQGGSHVVLFGGWTDSARTTYVAYEQTRPNTLRRSTPYAYWNNSAGYVPYRYLGVTASARGWTPVDGLPGSLTWELLKAGGVKAGGTYDPDHS